MSLIDHAAQMLASSRHGDTVWDTFDAPARERWRQDVRIVLQALREPDEEMAEAGAEIIRTIGPGESAMAQCNEAKDTWRFMVAALLGEPEDP